MKAVDLTKKVNQYRLTCYLGEQQNTWEHLRLLVDTLDNCTVPREVRKRFLEQELELRTHLKVLDEHIRELLKERKQWKRKSKL